MIAYRRAQEQDVGFVVGTWLDTYRTSHAAGLAPMEGPDGYAPVYRRWIHAVLDRPAQVLVAHVPGADQGADLVGWLCYELDARAPARMVRSSDERRAERVDRDALVQVGPLVHYVYVLQAYRRHRVAAGLFEAAGIDPSRPFYASCKTAVSTTIERARAGRMVCRFNPLIARFPKQNEALTPEVPRENRSHSVQDPGRSAR